MPGRSGPVVLGAVVTAALVLGTAWLLWERGETRKPLPSSGGIDGPGPGNAIPTDGARASAHPDAGTKGPSGPVPPRAVPEPAPPPGPDDGLDAPSWRDSRLAFRPRELGKIGPYVKAGLDAARREMAFCYRQAGGPPPPRTSDPAILLLYLEAREGALDIIDTRTEYLGTSAPEVVECCREVLRGREIPAFDTEPGRRYRVKYRLQ